MKRCIPGIIAIVFLLFLSTNAVFAKEHEVKASFMKAPLSFVKNDGQKDPSILYYEQGSGHVTSFTKDGISFTLSKMAKVKDTKQTPEVVTLTPLDASPFTIEAIDQREGKINYLIGNDSKKWKTNVPTYGAILYKNIYPGIDVKFYGTNSQLEYDIIVSPQADPSKVRFSYKGIEKFSLTPAGDLYISLSKKDRSSRRSLSSTSQSTVSGKRLQESSSLPVIPMASRWDPMTRTILSPSILSLYTLPT